VFVVLVLVVVLVLEKAIPPQALRTAAQCWRPMEGLREKTLFEDEDDDEYENDKPTPSSTSPISDPISSINRPAGTRTRIRHDEFVAL
jgi:hypothetical protein